jgi:hypothetical protein
MHSMRARARLFVVGAVAPIAAASASCWEATQITLHVTSDDCARVRDTRIVVADSSAAAEAKSDFPAGTTGCAGGQIGTLVLTPSGDRGATVAIRVVSGIDAPCAGDPTKCVEAKRVLRFVPHTPLVLPVRVTAKCVGVVCAGDTTCDETSGGACVPDVIDSTTCTDGTCELGGGAGAPNDGGVPPRDGSLADGPLFDVTADAPQDGPSEAGANDGACVKDAGAGTVPCVGAPCDVAAGQVCCIATSGTTPVFACLSSPCFVDGGSSSGIEVGCDETADCAGGVCCASVQGANTVTACQAACSKPTAIVCTSDCECPPNYVCTPCMTASGISQCQTFGKSGCG